MLERPNQNKAMSPIQRSDMGNSMLVACGERERQRLAFEASQGSAAVAGAIVTKSVAPARNERNDATS